MVTINDTTLHSNSWKPALCGDGYVNTNNRSGTKCYQVKWM